MEEGGVETAHSLEEQAKHNAFRISLFGFRHYASERAETAKCHDCKLLASSMGKKEKKKKKKKKKKGKEKKRGGGGGGVSPEHPEP